MVIVKSKRRKDLKDLEKQLEYFEGKYKENPNDVNTLDELVTKCVMLNEFKKGKKYAKELLKIQKDEETLFSLMTCYAGLDKLGKAMEIYHHLKHDLKFEEVDEWLYDEPGAPFKEATDALDSMREILEKNGEIDQERIEEFRQKVEV